MSTIHRLAALSDTDLRSFPFAKPQGDPYWEVSALPGDRVRAVYLRPVRRLLFSEFVFGMEGDRVVCKDATLVKDPFELVRGWARFAQEPLKRVTFEKEVTPPGPLNMGVGENAWVYDPPHPSLLVWHSESILEVIRSERGLAGEVQGVQASLLRLGPPDVLLDPLAGKNAWEGLTAGAVATSQFLSQRAVMGAYHRWHSRAEEDFALMVLETNKPLIDKVGTESLRRKHDATIARIKRR